jgi:DNA-binding NtrC family response regulator
MYEYHWPGNVREMENTIERCIILAEKDYIEIEDFPPHIKSSGHFYVPESSANLFEDNNVIPFEKLKEEAIRHALKGFRRKYS